MGLPPMSASGLPGKRVDANRAGITTMMLAGGLAIYTLPVSQYPPIAPPQITINASYPGASAQTVQDTVTQVIEQKMNGIDNLIYMASSSDSAGAVTITLTFAAGTGFGKAGTVTLSTPR